MAGTEFSADQDHNAGGAGGRPIGAGPGAMSRNSDRGRRQVARQAQPRRGAGPPAAGRGAPDQLQLGHPGWGQPQPDETPVGDYRHVQLLAQHSNIGRLGRDLRFGHWANLTGEFRQLLDKGQLPFDIFEDGP